MLSWGLWLLLPSGEHRDVPVVPRGPLQQTTAVLTGTGNKPPFETKTSPTKLDGALQHSRAQDRSPEKQNSIMVLYFGGLSTIFRSALMSPALK